MRCRYVGMWDNNKKNGYGTFYYHSGAVYAGHFVDDLRHGQGKITFMAGSAVEESYEGSWEHDEWHGYGTYRYRKEEGEGTVLSLLMYVIVACLLLLPLGGSGADNNATLF